MKLIKRSLTRGERVVCKNTAGVLYRGVVRTLHQNGDVTLDLDRPIRSAETRSDIFTWKAFKNSSKTYDGGYSRQTYGWSESQFTGRINNFRTGGSWIYSEAVEDWSKEF